MSARRKLWILGTVILGFAVLAHGPAFAESSIVDALRPYRSELLILRTTHEPDMLVRLVDVSADQMSVTVAGVPRNIPVADVIEVSRTGTSTSKGAKIGAGAGLGVGIFATQGLDCSTCVGEGTAVVALSTATYAAIGAWIGSRHHARVVVYRNPCR